ncbi:MAG TPA: tyrosine-type recombinase/integrase, partial [Symbiobacteriaceae bacterium]|nr:tyrosine-type recombinase/integrase [Symbiobacteriaceae bacterium]
LVRQTITWPSRTARGLERKALRSRADEGARAEFVFKPRTKNGKPRRVPLVSSVAPVLQDLKRRQRELIMRERQVWEPHDLIFPAPESGRPLRPDRVNRNLKRILADADLPVIRFHDLRHSAASVLFALGCTAIEVAGILGHTTPAITLKLYGHLMPGATKGVATKLEGALFGQADDKRKANRPR